MFAQPLCTPAEGSSWRLHKLFRIALQLCLCIFSMLPATKGATVLMYAHVWHKRACTYLIKGLVAPQQRQHSGDEYVSLEEQHGAAPDICDGALLLRDFHLQQMLQRRSRLPA